jgi:hypothetical protein
MKRAAITLLLLAGCSASHADRPPTYPVHGQVLVGGKPAAGARVRLVGLDNAALARLVPHAECGADGSFQLTTFRTGDGAPAGRYALTLAWPSRPTGGREEGLDRFKGRYADPRRPVREVRVVAGVNELGRIEIQ